MQFSLPVSDVFFLNHFLKKLKPNNTFKTIFLYESPRNNIACSAIKKQFLHLLCVSELCNEMFIIKYKKDLNVQGLNAMNTETIIDQHCSVFSFIRHIY
jgi:hypothetical protein